MFSYISQNWRGKPLLSIETIINLIGSTKTKKGLKIQTAADVNPYVRAHDLGDSTLPPI